MALTWRQIEAFHAVMTEGTIVRAAGALHVSQPAVSRLISDMEFEVGYTLFDRTKGRLKPTTAAVALFEEVDRAFTGKQEIERLAKAIARTQQQTLRVISLSVTTRDLLAHAIAKFSQKYPKVHVSLDIQPKERVIEWLEARRSDIGICTLPIESDRIEVHELKSFDLIAVVPEDHVLANEVSIVPSQLSGTDFVALPDHSGARPVVQQMLDEHEVKVEIRVEAANADALIGLVAAGAGVAVVTSAYRTISENVRGVQTIEIKSDNRLPIGMLLPTNPKPSATTQDFMKILRETYA
ncbi:MAG: LysR substrate-binding domain-containing protein [Pseudomonadota bacterium]